MAYPKKSDVDEHYFKLASRLLQDDNTKPGALVHIATHDIPLQERIQSLIAERKIARERYEFAMLYGIQTQRQRDLAAAGTRVRCLISYGEHWFPWYMRRLGERPANIWFVVKNMFGDSLPTFTSCSRGPTPARCHASTRRLARRGGRRRCVSLSPATTATARDVFVAKRPSGRPREARKARGGGAPRAINKVDACSL